MTARTERNERKERTGRNERKERNGRSGRQGCWIPPSSFRTPGVNKAEYVRQVFDTIADRYDQMNAWMTAGLIHYWHRAFARATGLRPGDQALDVACGTGELALIMAGQVAARAAGGPAAGLGQPGRVVGIDFSPDMLAVAREKVNRRRRSGRATLELQYGDALHLPFANNTFHCVASGFALRNLADLRRALAEMARVTRPGGRVVCLELSHPQGWLAGPYLLYFRHIVPWLGRWAAHRFARQVGPKRAAALPSPYMWLPLSLAEIPSQSELAQTMREIGLNPVIYRNLTGGVVALHVGQKPTT